MLDRLLAPPLQQCTEHRTTHTPGTLFVQADTYGGIQFGSDQVLALCAGTKPIQRYTFTLIPTGALRRFFCVAGKATGIRAGARNAALSMAP